MVVREKIATHVKTVNVRKAILDVIRIANVISNFVKIMVLKMKLKRAGVAAQEIQHAKVIFFKYYFYFHK